MRAKTGKITEELARRLARIRGRSLRRLWWGGITAVSAYPTGGVAAGMVIGATLTAAAFNAQKSSCSSLVGERHDLPTVRINVVSAFLSGRQCDLHRR